MRILVVGSGGREHALCWHVRADRPDADLYLRPRQLRHSRHRQDRPPWPRTTFPASSIGPLPTAPDLVIVGPEDPCALGLVDRLAEAGIRAFGPSAAATRLESSKGLDDRAS